MECVCFRVPTSIMLSLTVLEETSYTRFRSIPLLVPAAVMSDISNQFLPNLKKLETLGTCLGQWSRLFECHRPLMTDVTLNCFHFGLPTLSRFNWSDIPELWPNLRQLIFSDGPSTLNALRFIVPLLNEFH